MIEEMYPVMERIIDSYMEGTDYDIRMDDDGLITAGSGLDQVTWMDVRVGEILPTPRHGKPVEINADETVIYGKILDGGKAMPERCAVGNESRLSGQMQSDMGCLSAVYDAGCRKGEKSDGYCIREAVHTLWPENSGRS